MIRLEPPRFLLGEELEFFESMRKKWLENYKDKFVLIKGKELIGVFDSFSAAYGAGVKKLGNTPFLIKQVTEKEQAERFPALTLGIIHADL